MNEPMARAIAVSALSLAMIIGLVGVFWNKIQRGAGFGFLFIRFVALIEIVPGVMILAILDVLDTAATATLLGVVAGYFFGTRSKEEDSA